MNTTTYPRRTYSSSRTEESNSYQPHPAQEAVTSIIKQYEGKYAVTAEFTRDEASMSLFKRENSIVIGFICTLYDQENKCLSQGRGVSYIAYPGEKYVQRAILYARNASLIDCAMRASKLATIFAGDDKEGDDHQTEKNNYFMPAEQKPSEKQVKYLKNLIESLPSDEQNELLVQLPQMSKFEVSQLINNLKD